uniref:Uncharacterized protein n=1 Tax=Bionectria ochroleuca TaxID=29856 RepID=A0A8H7NNY4_BIOOC
MEFLSRHTNVPSLRMCEWAYESEPTNTVGIGYILMQKLDGKPQNWQGATIAQKQKARLSYFRRSGLQMIAEAEIGLS